VLYVLLPLLPFSSSSPAGLPSLLPPRLPADFLYHSAREFRSARARALESRPRGPRLPARPGQAEERASARLGGEGPGSPEGNRRRGEAPRSPPKGTGEGGGRLLDFCASLSKDYIRPQSAGSS